MGGDVLTCNVMNIMVGVSIHSICIVAPLGGVMITLVIMGRVLR